MYHLGIFKWRFVFPNRAVSLRVRSFLSAHDCLTTMTVTGKHVLTAIKWEQCGWAMHATWGTSSRMRDPSSRRCFTVTGQPQEQEVDVSCPSPERERCRCLFVQFLFSGPQSFHYCHQRAFPDSSIKISNIPMKFPQKYDSQDTSHVALFRPQICGNFPWSGNTGCETKHLGWGIF